MVKEGIARFSIQTGKKIESRSLIADGWYYRSDSIASALVLIGIITGRYLWWIDSVMGIAVSALIFFIAFEVLKGSISILLGEEPDNP